MVIILMAIKIMTITKLIYEVLRQKKGTGNIAAKRGSMQKNRMLYCFGWS